MITVAECIRINNLNTMNKITLEYMHIAKAAQYCEAYFTSIMYAELWALQIEAASQYTLVQIKSESRLQEIMKKVSKCPIYHPETDPLFWPNYCFCFSCSISDERIPVIPPQHYSHTCFYHQGLHFYRRYGRSFFILGPSIIASDLLATDKCLR